MLFPTIPTLVSATLVVGAIADFQIYFQQTVAVNPIDSAPSESESIRIFHGEPSCNDVSLGHSLGLYEDASSRGARCEGCDLTKGFAEWDISELEMHDGQGGDWGHYTLYKPTYQLTPAGGGPLKGKCTRDTGHDFSCTTGLALMTGTRLFKCVSPKGGMD